MATNVETIYFSPTHTTKQVTETVARALASASNATVYITDCTLPASRPISVECGEGDVLVFGFPVYAGRVPEAVLEQMSRCKGVNTPVVVVALYGNRDYDDALLEACNALREQGFNVIAAGAFIGEHSMTARVATGRPNADDLAVAQQFGKRAAAKLASSDDEPLTVKGSFPYKDRPAPEDIRPQTTDACTSCGICVERCPMGIISADDPALVEAGCIRCNACVKSCPEDAKFFDSESTNKVKALLESHFVDPKQPELFV